MDTATTYLRLLSEPTRLRLLLMLQTHGELCVCELTAALESIQPRISRHLATLRDGGVVVDRRDGQWIFYRLHPELAPWKGAVLEHVTGAMVDDPAHRADCERLAAMVNRPVRRCCENEPETGVNTDV